MFILFERHTQRERERDTIMRDRQLSHLLVHSPVTSMPGDEPRQGQDTAGTPSISVNGRD